MSRYEPHPDDFDEAGLLSVGFPSVDAFLMRYPDGDCRMIVDESDDELIDYYMNGMCAPFALALQRKTGWALAGVFRPPYWIDRPLHLVCLAPDGTYADARGLNMDASTVCADLGEGAFVAPVDDLEAFRFWRHPAHHRQADEHVWRLLPDLSEKLTADDPQLGSLAR